MVEENEQGDRSDASADAAQVRPRRHRAARRPAGPPGVHPEPTDPSSGEPSGETAAPPTSAEVELAAPVADAVVDGADGGEVDAELASQGGPDGDESPPDAGEGHGSGGASGGDDDARPDLEVSGPEGRDARFAAPEGASGGTVPLEGPGGADAEDSEDLEVQDIPAGVEVARDESGPGPATDVAVEGHGGSEGAAEGRPAQGDESGAGEAVPGRDEQDSEGGVDDAGDEGPTERATSRDDVPATDVAAEGHGGSEGAAEGRPAQGDESGAGEAVPGRAELDPERGVESAGDEGPTEQATSREGQVAVTDDADDLGRPARSDDQDEQVRGRRNRRATRGVVTAPFSSSELVAPAPVTRAADRPAPALFQAPDLTAAPADLPIAGGQPASDGGPDEEAAESETRATAAEVRRSRRAVRPGGAPAPIGEAVTSAPGEPETAEAGPAESEGERDEDDDQPRRRRRRGGRRRRRSGPGGEDEAGASDDLDEPGGGVAAVGASDAAEGPGDETGGATTAEAGTDEAAGAGEEEEPGSGRRRRRRRRRAGVAEEMEDLSSDDPPNTVTKVRESRRSSDEVVGVRGSTRIEAKKQRRRDGREAGRRRAPILTEAEFLARRESVNRVMCVRQHAGRTQIAVLEDGVLVEHYVNRADSSSMVGNVYLGKVQNVLPSMEAAFVDIGRGRNAVLYAGEVNWDAAGLEGQPKRIELALKSGDPVLVQVTKDPIAHKGARLTSQISLPGRFLVYVPEGSMTGISRKLPDTERARLKGILKDVVPEGAGVIVRTAAEGASEAQLTADVLRLTDEWADIQRKAKASTPPSLLYGEPDLAIKVVRDIFNEDFTSLLVQGDATTRTLADYVGRVAPDLLGRVQQWIESEDLYTAHRIDEQLAKALDRKVWLPSGGSLVIDRTEAMTVVDVNTGKFTGQGGNLEETVTRNNLEAAEEIVRQLRLRDIGGIIVIDFIDMVLESNRDLVLRRLVECLGRDRTKHQVAEVTSLGLVQMTRKRIGQGLLEVFSTPCEACGGRGHVVHTEPVGSGIVEENGRGRDRGNRRGQRPAPQVSLGGKQTGKTPPPPKFDEYGHIDHSAEHPVDELAGHPEDQGAAASEPTVSVGDQRADGPAVARADSVPESVHPDLAAPAAEPSTAEASQLEQLEADLPSADGSEPEPAESVPPAAEQAHPEQPYGEQPAAPGATTEPLTPESSVADASGETESDAHRPEGHDSGLDQSAIDERGRESHAGGDPRGDGSEGEPSGGGDSGGEPPVGEQTTEGASGGGDSGGEHAVGEQPQEGDFGEEPSGGGDSGGEQAMEEQASGDGSDGEPSGGGDSGGEPPVEEQNREGDFAEEPSGGGDSDEEQHLGHESGDDAGFAEGPGRDQGAERGIPEVVV